MATPHARGSTVAQAMQPVPVVGYPACAGIDLFDGITLDFSEGLPRMRGDRPIILGAIEGGLLATPHARGSTSARRLHGPAAVGYPACAGIDLIKQFFLLLHKWQPACGGRCILCRAHVASLR